MKKIMITYLFISFLILGASVSATAQFVVKIRPVAPAIVRVAPPSPGHVWVDGEWVWRGGGYQYVNGYWMLPPARAGLWVPGHWKQTRRGWLWKPGHWRRR